MHFLAHIHTKDTNFIFGTPHTQYRYTQTNGHTQIHMNTDVVPLSHFALFVICMYAKDTNFIFDIPQIYTCTYTQTHAHTFAETPAHTDTDTCTQTYISTHADIHTPMHIFFYIHKHTHIYIYITGQFCLLILYLVAICQMSSGPMDLFLSTVYRSMEVVIRPVAFSYIIPVSRYSCIHKALTRCWYSYLSL